MVRILPSDIFIRHDDVTGVWKRIFLCSDHFRMTLSTMIDYIQPGAIPFTAFSNSKIGCPQPRLFTWQIISGHA